MGLIPVCLSVAAAARIIEEVCQMLSPHLRSYSMNQVNRVYTVMLIVLAFFLLLGIGEMILLPRMVVYSSFGKLVLNYIKVIFSIYFCAAILTLILRAKRPAAGRVAATALNLALLAIIPFGTVVGIFGLSKLDKE
jgi:hypothetical protein